MVVKLKTVVWDAPDIEALADFYVGVAGLTKIYSGDDWVTLTSDDGWRFGIQYAPDHIPPRWPDPAYPQQMHVDFWAADIDAAAEHAESLGAQRLGGGDTWHTLADLAGHPFCFCQRDAEDGAVFAVTIDTEDAPTLSRFYAALMGLDVTYEGPAGVLLGKEGERQVMFQQIADHRRPRWPDPAHPQQLHLDIFVSDPDEAEQAALELGATKLPGDGDDWRVYADPHGHPFCLLTNEE